MRNRCTILAVFAIVLLVVGQLVAFAHEASARHITCEQHGEQIDAAQLASAVDGCENEHWIGVVIRGGEHEDCVIARALRQNTTTHQIALTSVTTTLATMTPVLAPEHAARTFELYLIAPKTSPPA